MNLLQKKLMQKYYNKNPPQHEQIQRKKETRENQPEIGYFDYTDRGTREFMRGEVREEE
jgi:hypothetical protein